MDRSRHEESSVLTKSFEDELMGPRKVVHYVAKGSSTRRIVEGDGALALCGDVIADPRSTDGRNTSELAPCEDCLHIYDQLEP